MPVVAEPACHYQLPWTLDRASTFPGNEGQLARSHQNHSINRNASHFTWLYCMTQRQPTSSPPELVFCENYSCKKWPPCRLYFLRLRIYVVFSQIYSVFKHFLTPIILLLQQLLTVSLFKSRGSQLDSIFIVHLNLCWSTWHFWGASGLVHSLLLIGVERFSDLEGDVGKCEKYDRIGSLRSWKTQSEQ